MAVATPQPSPNPNALRFQLDTVVQGGPLTWSSADEAASSPFAAAVFATDGVASIFATNDFVTVTRKPGAAWEPIVEAVQQAAADHL